MEGGDPDGTKLVAIMHEVCAAVRRLAKPMLVLSMLGRLPDRSGTVNHPPPTFSRGRTFILFFPCPKLR